MLYILFSFIFFILLISLFWIGKLHIYAGSENFLVFLKFRIDLKNILKLAKSNKRSVSKSKVFKYVYRFSPSPIAAEKIFRVFICEFDKDLYISTSDPFIDGISSGLKYALGLKNLYPSFSHKPLFIFRTGGKLILFVKIAFVWIIDIVKKEVKNVLHRSH